MFRTILARFFLSIFVSRNGPGGSDFEPGVDVAIHDYST